MDFRVSLKNKKSHGLCHILPKVRKDQSLSLLQSLLANGDESASPGGVTLKDIVQFIRTGRTPGRSSYTEARLSVLKVGNLTGSGIDWIARDRQLHRPC